jgi:3D (Asp-Asp-Asp) domain-containing protein
VKLPSEAAAPVAGLSGVLIYNYAPAAYAGHDSVTTTYSDLDSAPLGAPVVVVNGDPTAKFVLSNTVAGKFLGIAQYPGRVMVNGFGATATVAVGDYLVPGKGNDIDGYWESQASATGAWAVITGIDTARLEVEAQMLF